MDTLNNNPRRRVGVVGLGAVGSALKHTLGFFHEVFGYDLIYNFSWDDILRTDTVFICVSTPLGKDKRLDCSDVTNVLVRLDNDGYGNPIVIRSTLRVGFMEEAECRFPKLRLVYSPEFLREKSRFQWSVWPDRLVLSGNEEDIRAVLPFFDWVEDAKILTMDFRSAELAKLAHNAFIATKVSFTNEIQTISSKLGADPVDVMDVVASDRRIASHEHLHPYRGPYGGKCVPKDVEELLRAAGDAILLSAVKKVNERVKSSSRRTEVPRPPIQHEHTRDAEESST